MLLTRIKRYFENSIAEIAGDPSLRIYGVALCLVHSLTFYFVSRQLYAPSYFNYDKGFGGGVCWSFLPGCDSFSVSVTASAIVGTLYLLVSAVGAASFAFGRIRLGYWLLILLSVVKSAAMMIDYRTMGNYHYMATISTLAFLFIPGRVLICQAFLVAFYFSSGILKLNDEWLSGLALHAPVGGIMLEWLCAYAAILELAVVFLLFSRIKWLRWFVLFQLVVFHIFSYQFVGFFYPYLMALLLLIFPLSWRFPRERKWNRAQIAALALFAFAQVIPLLQSGDPALVGRGRLFAVNMFDSAPECFSQFFVRYDQSNFEVKFHRPLTPRIRCDPLVFWNFGRRLCDQNKNQTGFREIDFLMNARRETDSVYTELFHVENFCTNAKSFNTLLTNDWSGHP